jgi:glycosyltransferase involved in cell wall biosynthesis
VSRPPLAKNAPLSACIITFDEEDRIDDCLASVDFCDEWIVVDSHSRDRTRERAAARGARVIERDWPGHVAQKEFAIRQATHDWVLCIDADERVGPRLREEILRLKAQGFEGRAGWDFPRKTFYLGRFIEHGLWYPDRQLRLFDRRRGRWGGNDPHDKVLLDGPRGHLAGDLLHYSYRDFANHLATIDRYTTIMAQGLLARGRRARPIDLVTHPLVRFVRGYVFKAGFLDGWRGLLIAFLAAHYVRMKYAKLLVLQRAADERERR